MRLNPEHLEQARKVADAILYEGYLLYPYRRSAQKNQIRFQFGVLMPPGYRVVDSHEPSASQTECVLECADTAELRVLVRFLQLQQRIVQRISPRTGEWQQVDALRAGDTEYTSWQEATEREQPVVAPVAALLATGSSAELHIGAGELAEDIRDPAGSFVGRIVRRWNALDAVIGLHMSRIGGPYGALRLRLRVENRTAPDAPLRTRDDGLRHALIAAHSLIGVPGASFLSMTDPPEWAAADVAACENIGTWPVLAGPPDCRDLMLSAPVILYDHPEVARESAGDLFDATEIDEILTLRTLALTEQEKRQARASDPLAAQLMDRVDGLPPEMLERMHGAIRYLKRMPAGRRASPPGESEPGWPVPADSEPGWPSREGSEPGWPPPEGIRTPATPWWDPGSDASVSPETDHIVIDGIRIARGARVRMRPGTRRADAQDLFLAGRTAVVEAVLHDVDGQVHLAVTPDDDPAADLQRSHGRFLYFAADEVEPLAPADPRPADPRPAAADQRPGQAMPAEEGRS
jgi:hypothetical protein